MSTLIGVENILYQTRNINEKNRIINANKKYQTQKNEMKMAQTTYIVCNWINNL